MSIYTIEDAHAIIKCASQAERELTDFLAEVQATIAKFPLNAEIEKFLKSTQDYAPPVGIRLSEHSDAGHMANAFKAKLLDRLLATKKYNGITVYLIIDDKSKAGEILTNIRHREKGLLTKLTDLLQELTRLRQSFIFETQQRSNVSFTPTHVDIQPNFLDALDKVLSKTHFSHVEEVMGELAKLNELYLELTDGPTIGAVDDTLGPIKKGTEG